MRSLFLTLITCLFVLPVQAKYSGGTGEPNDPYQIATAADLIALGETPEDYDKHFILTADIDLAPNLPGRKVFDKAVIAPDINETNEWWRFDGTPFSGVFDGNGHVVSHLKVKAKDYLGLFGELAFGAEVKDLGVADVNITASGGSVGGLVGENGGGVTNCYSTGEVSGGSYYVGGLVGHNGGTLTQCYSTGEVRGSSDSRVGGLVGGNEGTVTNSYSTGAVRGTGQNSCVGGLVGTNYYGTVTNCYSTGTVIGSGYLVGGLAGYSEGRRAVTSCFWDTQTSGQTTSTDGTGKTTAEMQDPNTFMAAGWDFVGQPDGPSDIWAEPPGGGYLILWWQLSPLPKLPTFSGGAGEPNDPYRISTASELNAIGYNPRLMGVHFELVNDIDLGGIDFYIIGSEFCPFAGSFDGTGHTVSHLTITGVSYLGLFGVLEYGAAVSNLGVVDVNISGWGDCMGGLVGFNMGSVTQCYSTGAVSGGRYGVGGLVGGNDGRVTYCYSSAAVNGNYSCVGGLVGRNGVGFASIGSVTQCYSTGLVIGAYNVGGLVGLGDANDVVASFWDTQTSGRTESDGGTGKTTVEMQTAATFLEAGWDFVNETANGTEDLWWILEGKDYPRLWWEAAPQ